MSEEAYNSSFLFFLTILDFTLATFTVCGNLLLLVTILFDPLRCLRTPATYLVANLAVSDLLIGLFIGYGRALVEYFLCMGNNEPKWINIVINIGGGAALISGIWTVTAIAFDRYLAVIDPLHYSERVTARRAVMYILVSWPLSMALPAFYPFVGHSWIVFLLAFSHTHFTIPVFVLLVVYFTIFRSLSKRRSELLRLTTSISTMTVRHTLERERKMAWTSLMILMLFCASFMPFYVKIQLLNFCKCLQTMPYKKFDFISHVFLYLSSLMDPFMYAWRVPKFRRSLRECLRFRKRTAVRPIVIKMNSQKQNNDFIPAVSLDTGYSPVVRR